jgi:acetoin utilization deacetylase AcuC-like enzyme
MAGGYCFFNNAAIAAQAIASQTGEHVAILDVDVHHGNGTQQIFWRRRDVLYISLHADPKRLYPFFLGHADEIGEGPGRGANRNFPMPLRADDASYLATLDNALERIADEPGSIVVVSLGFDTYEKDPIGDLALTTAGYHEMGRRVAALGRRLVILQEGGYHLGALGENARAWLRGAAGRPAAEGMPSLPLVDPSRGTIPRP